MTLALLLGHATKVALLALLAGMVMRGKLRQCWSFVVYVVAILVSNVLQSVWPHQFITPSFWLVKQRTYDVLKTAIALELAWRVFAAFPGAWQKARVVLAAVLGLSTVAIFAVRPTASYSNFFDWQPKITTGAIWLLTATALVVVRYEIPIRDWQRAIMLGFAPYLLVFVTLMGLLKRHGWSFVSQFGTLDALAYLSLLLFWTYSGWRREHRLELPSGTGRGTAEELAPAPVEQPVEVVDAHA
ncbi:MAG TPA: hypothetical protein VEQ10_17510 [Vicinamibacteria bacterium]|nr:hypothetical protein [Vicinamibacteria bacterium]